MQKNRIDGKGITRLLAVLAAVLVVLVGLNLLLDRLNEKEPKKNVRQKVELYEPDYTCNIFEDPEYMDEENFIMYTENDQSTRIYNSAEAEAAGQLGTFFFNFIKDMIYGNYKNFNGYFTDGYLERYGRFGRFTMQRLYNIDVQIVSKEANGDGTFSYLCKLVFSIMKNDGTVFDFVPSDSSKPMYLTVVEDAGGASAKIDELDY